MTFKQILSRVRMVHPDAGEAYKDSDGSYRKIPRLTDHYSIANVDEK